MSEEIHQSLQEELSTLNNLEDCLLVSLTPTGRAREIDLLVDYVWDRDVEKKKPRPDVGYRSNFVRIRMQGLQDFDLFGDLTDAMRHEPERINWGLSEISFARSYYIDRTLGLTVFGLSDRQLECKFESYEIAILGANYDQIDTGSTVLAATAPTNVRNLPLREAIAEAVGDCSTELRRQMRTASDLSSSSRSGARTLQSLLERSGVMDDPIACLGDTLRSLEEADALQRVQIALSAGTSPENGRSNGERGGPAPDAYDLLYALSLAQRALTQPDIPGDAMNDVQVAQAHLNSRRSTLEGSSVIDFDMLRYGYGLELRIDSSYGANQNLDNPTRAPEYAHTIRLFGIQKLHANPSEVEDKPHRNCGIESLDVSRSNDAMALTLTGHEFGRMYAEFDAIDFVDPHPTVR